MYIEGSRMDGVVSKKLLDDTNAVMIELLNEARSIVDKLSKPIEFSLKPSENEEKLEEVYSLEAKLIEIENDCLLLDSKIPKDRSTVTLEAGQEEKYDAVVKLVRESIEEISELTKTAKEKVGRAEEILITKPVKKVRRLIEDEDEDLMPRDEAVLDKAFNEIDGFSITDLRMFLNTSTSKKVNDSLKFFEFKDKNKLVDEDMNDLVEYATYNLQTSALFEVQQIISESAYTDRENLRSLVKDDGHQIRVEDLDILNPDSPLRGELDLESDSVQAILKDTAKIRLNRLATDEAIKTIRLTKREDITDLNKAVVRSDFNDILDAETINDLNLDDADTTAEIIEAIQLQLKHLKALDNIGKEIQLNNNRDALRILKNQPGDLTKDDIKSVITTHTLVDDLDFAHADIQDDLRTSLKSKLNSLAKPDAIAEIKASNNKDDLLNLAAPATPVTVAALAPIVTTENNRNDLDLDDVDTINAIKKAALIRGNILTMQDAVNGLTDPLDETFFEFANAANEDEIRGKILSTFPAESAAIGLAAATVNTQDPILNAEATALKEHVVGKRRELFTAAVNATVNGITRLDSPFLKKLTANGTEAEIRNRIQLAINQNRQELFTPDAAHPLTDAQIKLTDDQLDAIHRNAKTHLLDLKGQAAAPHIMAALLYDKNPDPAHIADMVQPRPLDHAELKAAIIRNNAGMGLGLDADVVNAIPNDQLEKINNRLIARHAINSKVDTDANALDALRKASNPDEIRIVIRDQFPEIRDAIGLNPAPPPGGVVTDAEKAHDQRVLDDNFANDLKFQAMRKFSALKGHSEGFPLRIIEAQKYDATLNAGKRASIVNQIETRAISFAHNYDYAVAQAKAITGSAYQDTELASQKKKMQDLYNLTYVAREEYNRRLNEEKAKTPLLPFKQRTAITHLNAKINALEAQLAKVNEAMDILDSAVTNEIQLAMFMNQESKVIDTTAIAAAGGKAEAIQNQVAAFLGAAPGAALGGMAHGSESIKLDAIPPIVNKTMIGTGAKQIAVVSVQETTGNLRSSEIFVHPALKDGEGKMTKEAQKALSEDDYIKWAVNEVEMFRRNLKNPKGEIRLIGNLPDKFVEAAVKYCAVQGYPCVNTVTSYRANNADKVKLESKLNKNEAIYFGAGKRPAPNKIMQEFMEENIRFRPR